MPKTFAHTIQAGGVEETVSSDFNLDKALEREKLRAFIKFGRELEQAGYIESIPLARTGDYTKVLLRLRLP